MSSMFEAWRADPARAVGRLIGHIIYGVAYGKTPEAESQAQEDFVDEVAGALSACLERFSSPAVLFDPLTKGAVADADRQLAQKPVDVRALDGDIDSVRARIHLLEKRGLDHLPEYAYLKTKCDELTQKWRSSCHEQGEPTSMQPAPPPPDAAPEPQIRELSAVGSMYR
jgi:hypothetical protein